MQTDWRQQAEEQQRQAEQAAARQAEVRQRRLERLEQMFLTLGSDVLQLGDGTLAGAEFMDARSTAAGKWSRLLNLERQIERETASLAARPKTRPAEPSDQMLATEVVKRMEAAFAAEADAHRAGLEELKEQAKRERAELTRYVVKGGVPREERKSRR